MGTPPVTFLPRITDPRIDESSGLAYTNGVLLTINDSGSQAQVYAINPHTGKTIKTIRFLPGKANDTEAIAIGPQHTIWVADTGDNYMNRTTVTLYKLPPYDHNSPHDADVTAEEYPFYYPDQVHYDAETLLVHPQTGQRYVVTKDLRAAHVYSLPQDQQPSQRVSATLVAPMHSPVTDGAFTTDGRFVILRTQRMLTVHRYPSFHRIGTVPLPKQNQGEGLTTAPDGSIYLSSEGRSQWLLQLRLPPQALRAMATAPEELPGLPADHITPRYRKSDWIYHLLRHGILKHPPAVRITILGAGAGAACAIGWWLIRRFRRR